MMLNQVCREGHHRGELALAGVKELVHPLCGSRCATTVLSIPCAACSSSASVNQRCKVKMWHLCFFERRDWLRVGSSARA